MKIKAVIHVEYNIDPDKYRYLDPDNQEQSIRAIELHSLSTAVAEVMPWLDWDKDDQVLKIKLEE